MAIVGGKEVRNHHRHHHETTTTHLAEGLEGDLLGVVEDLDRLRVAREARAHKVIGGLVLLPLRVPDRGVDHARHALVGELQAPAKWWVDASL